MSDLISRACDQGKHGQCRGRVLNPEATSGKDRWRACSCDCGHNRKRPDLAKKP